MIPRNGAQEHTGSMKSDLLNFIRPLFQEHRPAMERSLHTVRRQAPKATEEVLGQNRPLLRRPAIALTVFRSVGIVLPEATQSGSGWKLSPENIWYKPGIPLQDQVE